MKPSQPLKICYIGWGHSIHTQRWVSWFAQKGHDVVLITNHLWGSNTIQEFQLHNVSSSNLINKAYTALKNFFYIRKIIRSFRPDILHLHTLYYPAYLGVYSGFKPLIVTPWNGDVIVKSSNRSIIQSMLCRKGLIKADIITVDSEDLRKGCLRYVNENKSIENIQWGVNLNIFNPTARKTDLKVRLNIPESDQIVLSTRHLAKEYGVETVVRSIPFVLKEIPAVHFIFLYLNAKDLTLLRELALSLEVLNRCHFLGSVKQYDDLATYYATADAYVSVSYWDTTSVSLLEAMACGVPPVVGDIPSVREWIKNGYNGFIVPLWNPEKTADAIIKSLKYPDKSRIFSEINIGLIKNRANHEKNMQRMESLYYSICRTSRKR